MGFTKNEISTYLFCAQLSQTRTTPLTILEWNAVVKSLGAHKLEPESLLSMTPSELVNVLTNATNAQKTRIVKKVEARQKLGISMLELEEIVQQGYGVMFRFQMPANIKKLTQKFVPAFFYYAGDISILSNRTLGVVGARNANKNELLQTAETVKKAAKNDIVIISGGARGVDTTAVDNVLQNGGKAVIFPSDGLEKWVKKSIHRRYIMDGQLLLMSTQRLNAPFSAAYAMQRNKYIHAPSDAVLVSSSGISGEKTSGTWEGILENLKMQWSPIYGIGNSIGVKKLIEENNAKPFTSLSEIFMKNTHVIQSDIRELKNNIIEAIQLAKAKGVDNKSIEEILVELLEQNIKLEKKAAEEDMVTKKTNDIEQLTIENLLEGEEHKSLLRNGQSNSHL